MGFNQKIVSLFMRCVSSVNYQITHASKTFGSITPSRGIRQDDPLSSYLFLICVEGFTALIHEYERYNLINGIKVARNDPFISHMLFTNDCYIFCKANMESVEQVLDMLKVLEKASGQQINDNKSSIFFSRNTDDVLKQEVCHRLRFKEAGDNILYLGLPNIVARRKTGVFGFLKEKLQECLQGWDKKKVSNGGKEILIKTVAQALPNYAMNMFLLPVDVCKDLERAMNKFWWRSNSNKDNCIHWMSWRDCA